MVNLNTNHRSIERTGNSDSEKLKKVTLLSLSFFFLTHKERGKKILQCVFSTLQLLKGRNIVAFTFLSVKGQRTRLECEVETNRTKVCAMCAYMSKT